MFNSYIYDDYYFIDEILQGSSIIYSIFAINIQWPFDGVATLLPVNFSWSRTCWSFCFWNLKISRRFSTILRSAEIICHQGAYQQINCRTGTPSGWWVVCIDVCISRDRSVMKSNISGRFQCLCFVKGSLRKMSFNIFRFVNFRKQFTVIRNDNKWHFMKKASMWNGMHTFNNAWSFISGIETYIKDYVVRYF